MQSIGKLFDKTIAHYERKEYRAAEETVDELLELHPDFQRGQFLKAVILEETGRADRAEEHYAKCGNRYTLWFRLASQLEGIDAQRALTYYERVGKNDAQNNLLWFSLGNLYERLGRQEEARASYRKLSPVREVLSRIVIPSGFIILLAGTARAMIARGDTALAFVVILSAVFCLFWLKRDGGTAVRMIRKKKKAG
jgi:tetratricopeptide (TPR) repeat protein